MIMDPLEGYQLRLEELKKASRLRVIPDGNTSFPDFEKGIPTIRPIDLCSNDYLGLASEESLAQNWIDDSIQSLVPADFSSSASRLLSDRQYWHSCLELELEKLYGKSSLVFNSGYHANVGTISALSIPGTFFLVDRLIHASVIDGLQLAGARFARWKHNDMESLKSLVNKFEPEYERIIVVAEGIYSMDGDEAPLPDIVDLKHQYSKLLIYLDEAHSFGVRGKNGLGLAEEKNCIGDVDIIIGTLGKACASSGAFVATSPILKRWLINSARSFIFSTALPPIACHWSLLNIRRIVKMQQERARLAEISKDFRNFIVDLTKTPNPSVSQIIPLIIGDAEKAVAFGKALAEAHISALPIRRPTVPPGGERIRFSFNASLSDKDLNYIKKEVGRIYASQFHT